MLESENCGVCFEISMFVIELMVDVHSHTVAAGAIIDKNDHTFCGKYASYESVNAQGAYYEWNSKIVDNYETD